MSLPARRFAVIGDPIAHSLSPVMHRAALARLGLAYVYDAIRVAAADLPGTLDHLRRGDLHGLNVTVPHKTAVVALADVMTDETSILGAANTLWVDGTGRLVAANTDVDGLAADLAHERVTPRFALVLGAGGAARAAVLALARMGADVAVAARRDDQAAIVAGEVGRARWIPWIALDDWPAAPHELDVIVNATSAGMLGGSPGEPIADALSRARCAADAVAYDLVYRPCAGEVATPFLQRAAAMGLRALDGRGMLVEQGARALSLFLGRPVGADARMAMRAALTVAIRERDDF